MRFIVFCKDWAWTHVKSFCTARWEAEGALHSTSFLFENISVVKCTAAYADWNRRLTPFIPVNLLLLTYIRVFFWHHGNYPHLQHCVRRWHFGMPKCLHQKVLISFYNDAHTFSIFFFIRITFGCLTGGLHNNFLENWQLFKTYSFGVAHVRRPLKNTSNTSCR